MRAIRWVLFGTLETGLERPVLIYSALILWCAFICGFAASTFVEYPIIKDMPLPADSLYAISLMVWFLAGLLFVRVIKFKAIIAVLIGFGIFCAYWIGTGLGIVLDALVAIPAGWSVVRGFAAGPVPNMSLS